MKVKLWKANETYDLKNQPPVMETKRLSISMEGDELFSIGTEDGTHFGVRSIELLED